MQSKKKEKEIEAALLETPIEPPIDPPLEDEGVLPKPRPRP